MRLKLYCKNTKIMKRVNAVLADILSGYLDPESDEAIPEVIDEDDSEIDEDEASTNKSTKDVKLDDDDEERRV